MSDVNYEAVDIPDDKPPSEYHWTERRAEILQLIEKAGHPGSISPTRLADRYDVSKSQISQDKSRLQEFIVEQIDEPAVDAITSTVFQTAVKELMDNDEYRKAAKTVADWNDWLGDRGHVEREPDRLEANVNLDVDDESKEILRETLRRRRGQ
jgi:hypothetical protein